MDELWRSSEPIGLLVLRAALIFGFVLTLLRLSGKRQIGEMSPAEFTALLLVSNSVENAMNGGDESVIGGFALAFTLIAISELIAYLAYRWKAAADILEGAPELVVHKGRPIERSLRRNKISMHELHSLLRMEGVTRLSQVKEAVLENNGSLSVIREEPPKRNPPEC